jgi:hypothetical protein
MKKQLLSIFIFGTSVAAFAQPTWNMESWSTMNNGAIAVPEEPIQWVTENQLVNPFTAGNDTSVFKVTGADAYVGSSMKITTVDVVNNPSAGIIPDPAGVAFTGKVQVSPFKIVRGFAYTSRPATCQFWYKYSPQASDSASCSVILSKWNGASRDIIASGVWQSAAAQATYAQATVTMAPNAAFLAIAPDTMQVAFSATRIATPTIGSTLWVDNVEFYGWTGVNEHPSSNGVNIFPNPASSFVTIAVDTDDATSVIAYDATGRMVSSAQLSESTNSISKKSGMINTSDLSSGLYSYSVVDKNGTTLRVGKFNVAH